MKQFVISSDERVCLIGKTGSGKTYLARKLLLKQKRVLIYDPRDGLDDWDTDTDSANTVNRIKDDDAFRIRIVEEDRFLTLLESVLVRGDVLVYIDEIYGITTGPTAYPKILRDIWTRGRSLNIGAWGATQRPKMIPLFFLSEAEHFFVYRLTMPADRKIVAGMAHEQLDTVIKDVHGFYYYDIRTDQPVYYKNARKR